MLMVSAIELGLLAVGLCLGSLMTIGLYRNRLQRLKVLEADHLVLQMENNRLLSVEDAYLELKNTIDQLKQKENQQEVDRAANDVKVNMLGSQIEQFLSKEKHVQLQLQAMQKELSSSKISEAKLLSDMNNARQQADEKMQVLKQAKENLSQEFENLANRIFEDKQQSFTKSSQQSLEQSLTPLREQIVHFRKKVEDTYDKESKDRQSLFHEIIQLKNLNQQMSEDAVNLTKALKGDNKVQGNWGEVILERVLEESGLRKGHEYDTQVNLTDEMGKRRAPDVVVRLPENKDVVVDAKVSLVDYEAYCSADSDEAREVALKRHIQSMRQHINGLSFKDYENLQGLRTLDFVLVFVPIEAAFLVAVEHDQKMFKEAYEKNIIIVSPTTLLATLRTVQSIWRYERQNKNADEIARQAGGLHDQFVLLLESLDEVGKHVQKTQEAFDQTKKRLTQGRGNLVSRMHKLQHLGIKSKKNIPDELLQQEADSEVC